MQLLKLSLAAVLLSSAQAAYINLGSTQQSNTATDVPATTTSSITLQVYINAYFTQSTPAGASTSCSTGAGGCQVKVNYQNTLVATGYYYDPSTTDFPSGTNPYTCSTYSASGCPKNNGYLYLQVPGSGASTSAAAQFVADWASGDNVAIITTLQSNNNSGIWYPYTNSFTYSGVTYTGAGLVSYANAVRNDPSIFAPSRTPGCFSQLVSSNPFSGASIQWLTFYGNSYLVDLPNGNLCSGSYYNGASTAFPGDYNITVAANVPQPSGWSDVIDAGVINSASPWIQDPASLCRQISLLCLAEGWDKVLHNQLVGVATMQIGSYASGATIQRSTIFPVIAAYGVDV